MYRPDYLMAAQNGTKVVTSSLSDSQFRAFIPHASTTISSLASKSIADDGTVTLNSDVLASHIEGGDATTLEAGVPVVCQEHSFTDVEVDGGAITVIF